MEWHSLATKMYNQGDSIGDITRTLRSTGAFGSLPHKICYDRVRRYLRKPTSGVNPSIQPMVQNYIPVTHSCDWDGNQKIKFALIGDTHINSKYTQLTHLHKFYDICQQEGVPVVYHCGDIDDGDQMRVGQEYELYSHGVDEHIDEIVRVYPHREGVVTKFITGNHDASTYKHNGMDIGKYISSMRSDMIYLGKDITRVNLTPNCVLELRHPWDGTSYAISHKSQKIIDNYDFDDRPQIVAIGHYHKAEQIFYRGIYCLQCGCFQARTPFEIGKNIIPTVGGWICEAEVNKDGEIVRLKSEFIPFTKSIKEDYKNFR